LCRLNIHPWWEVNFEDGFFPIACCPYCGKKVKTIVSDFFPSKKEFMKGLDKVIEDLDKGKKNKEVREDGI